MPEAPRRPLTRSELDEAVQRERTLQQQALREKISPAAWLASAPFMTLTLADQSGLKNTGVALEALAREGLVRQSIELQPDSNQERETVYSMTSAGRTTVLDLFEQPQNQISQLRSVVASSAAQLTINSSVPDSIVRWVALARYAHDSTLLIAAFEDRIDAAYKKRDAEALLNWIDTARPLSELLLRDVDDSLKTSIEKAGRRLELLHRRASDERHLTSFLQRDDQIKALRDLVKGPDDAWALHLFGVGGVGKTMLLRYLTGSLAETREFRAATARIDFDYLNPDYPSLDPGLILWSFAQELRAYATDQRAIDKFDACDQKLQRLRQELTADGRMGERRGTESPLFLDAVVNFVDALKSLERRVILIVDTCEELAKMRPDGTSPANVAETFRILTALHDGPLTLTGQQGSGGGVPSLRVVFAGRRPLAQSGRGWQCPTSKLPARPYLGLHELRGFTHGEAREYLRRIMKVPDSLVEAVIDRSPDIGPGGSIQWEMGESTPTAPRCNPYDLRLYADWAREVPPPDAETIRKSTAEHYVELRILRRLESYEPLRRLMPVVALLKYVDEEVVTAALRDGTTAGQAYARLRDQDWMAERRIAAGDGAAGRVTLSVEERLRKRLWTYFRERGGVPHTMLAPILDHFQTMAETADLRLLDWAVFDAGLRVFEYDPTRGAHWWAAVERRIVKERGYEWLLQVTGSLLADPNAAARPSSEWHPSSLRAAVAAAYLDAAAHSRAQRTPDVTWQDVLDSVDMYPLEEERALLRWRATVGLVAHAASSPAADVSQLTGLVEPLLALERIPDVAASQWVQAVGATVAAWDALVELIDRQGGQESDAWRALAPVLIGQVGPAALAEALEAGGNYELAAYAHSLAMRVADWTGDGLALASGERSLACADQIREQSQRWLDWEPPEDLRARVRLEFARSMYPRYLFPAQVIARITPPSRPTGLDEDRLLAVIRIILAATKVVPEGGPDLERFAAAASCAAHRAIPPAAVVIATQAAENGRVADALASLNRMVRAGSSGDLTVVRHAQRAVASILVRMRLMEVDERIPGVLSESPVPGDRGLLWTAASRLGDDDGMGTTVPGFVPDGREARAPWLHELWQSRVALGDDAADAASWANENLAPMWPERHTLDVGAGFAAVSTYFDVVEARLLAHGRTDWIDAVIQLPQVVLAFRSRPEEVLELLLRYNALSDNETDATLYLNEPVSQLGVRRAATIAFELGDDLMMRLPHRAESLFEQANNWFVASEDPIGAFLSTVRIAIINPAAATRAIDAYRNVQRSLDLPALLLDGASGKAARDADQQVIATAAPGWRPHLARLAACVYRDLSTPAAPAVPFGPDVDLTIVLSQIAAPVVAVPSVAAESAPAYASAAAPAETPPIPSFQKSTASRVLKSVFEVVKTAATAVAGLAMAAAALLLLYRMFISGVNTVSPVSIDGLPAVGLFAATLVILAVSPGAFQRVWHALGRVSVTVRMQRERDGYSSRVLGERVYMDVERRVPWLTVRPPFVHLSLRNSVSAAISTGGLSAYADTAADLPPEIIGALRALRRRPGQPTTIELNIARGLQGAPWEAMLQFAGEMRDSFIPFSCVRVERRPTPWPAPHPRHVLGVITGERSLQLATAGWAPLNRLRIGPWRWRRGFDAGSVRSHRTWATIDEATQSAPVGVLHLIGRVEDRTDGDALEFVTQGSPDEYGGHRSFRPGDIIDQYPKAQLIVLQPEPYAQWPDERYPSDREAASRLRLFAGELSADGVPLVVVLPAMDTPYCVRALALLARLLSAFPTPPARALARTMAAIQRLVAAHPGSAIVAAEACFDAAVFNCRSSRSEPEFRPTARKRRPTEKMAPPRDSYQRPRSLRRS